MKDIIKLIEVFAYRLLYLEKQSVSLNSEEARMTVIALTSLKNEVMLGHSALTSKDDVLSKMSVSSPVSEAVKALRVESKPSDGVFYKIPIYLVDRLCKSLAKYQFSVGSMEIFLGYESDEAALTEFGVIVDDLVKALDELCLYFSPKESK